MGPGGVGGASSPPLLVDVRLNSTGALADEAEVGVAGDTVMVMGSDGGRTAKGIGWTRLPPPAPPLLAAAAAAAVVGGTEGIVGNKHGSFRFFQGETKNVIYFSVYISS
jgi:hypothetical protein